MNLVENGLKMVKNQGFHMNLVGMAKTENVIAFLNKFLKDCIAKMRSKNVFFFKSRKNPEQTPIYIVDI